MNTGPESKTIHIFISHLHYDHIQGIPFFTPAYIPRNKIIFHGGHDNLKESLSRHMKAPYFPINIDTMGAEVVYEKHTPGDIVEVGIVESHYTSRITPEYRTVFALSTAPNPLFIPRTANTECLPMEKPTLTSISSVMPIF